jgi:hypothetical protein
MAFSPPVRRLALVLHVIASVGFPGAVACFLALALIGLAGDASVERGSYAAMQVITSFIIVPLCLASLVSGLASAWGTPWGVLRHWWVVVKLAITVLSTIILLVHLSPIDALAHATPSSHLSGTQIQMIAASGAALVALLFMTVVSVYKPRGLTRHGAAQLQR